MSIYARWKQDKKRRKGDKVRKMYQWSKLLPSSNITSKKLHKYAKNEEANLAHLSHAGVF